MTRFAALAEHVVGTGMSIRFRASGDSMYPAILHGDVITVAPVAAHEIVRGDILLFRDGDRVRAHRLVRVVAYNTETRFRLRGDTNARCDAPVAASQIVGRVEAVERDGRAIALHATPSNGLGTSATIRRYLMLCRRLLA
ncbi:MAG TPA: S24/S26 family peptidase [Vicinamibacterales bacterium]